MTTNNSADERPALLAALQALNDNLAAHGIAPLITLAAGQALPDDNLRKAVRASGDYLIDVTAKLSSSQ
ncbi:MAG TPA: hypothetical protein VGF65_11455 [Mycobacterium sp.]|jgi:hypothetical protein